MVVYYPAFFPKNGNVEQTILRHKRVNILLDSIIEKNNNQNEHLFKVEKEILEHDTPNVWNIHREENMERALEVDFQKFGIAVANQTSEKLAEMTTFTFYATVEHLKEKNKPK